MLVFSRFVNERIRIGKDITVMVCGIRNGKVRIGIEAPREIPVHRQEIAELIDRAQEDFDLGGEAGAA